MRRRKTKAQEEWDKTWIIPNPHPAKTGMDHDLPLYMWDFSFRIQPLGWITGTLRVEKSSRIMESKLGWINIKCHIQEFLGYLPGWALQALLGSPFQCLRIFSMEQFQPEPSLDPRPQT